MKSVMRNSTVLRLGSVEVGVQTDIGKSVNEEEEVVCESVSVKEASEMKEVEEMDEHDTDIEDDGDYANMQSIGNVSISTTDMVHLCSLEDVMIENDVNNNQERVELHTYLDEKFGEYRQDLSKEIADMMVTLNDMKHAGMKIDNEQSQKQMVLVLNEVMNEHYVEMRECVQSMIASNKEVCDHRNKVLTETQTKYSELVGRYAALSVQTKSEYEKYENDRTVWQLRVGELLNYIWLQNEKKCAMEVAQNELIGDMKIKENEMKKTSNELRERTNLMMKQMVCQEV